MRTTDLSRIYSGTPLNSTAAGVTGNRGEQWSPKPNLGNCVHWESPPPVIHPSQYPKAASFEDLRGLKMGKFTVFGYLGKPNPKKKSRWVMRCVCGHYESRNSNVIRATDDPTHQCKNCDYQHRLRNGHLSKIDGSAS